METHTGESRPIAEDAHGLREVHLVTGATGFLGSALVLELLSRGAGRIRALVRPTPRESARLRLHGALAEAARNYGREDLIPLTRQRCEAVEGDLSAPSCGLSPAALAGVETIWHCGASLDFTAAARQRTLLQNREGTLGLLRLAAAAGVSEFAYVSTAYVAGTGTGTVPEAPVPEARVANNPYEESKMAAERTLLEHPQIRIRVLRPSIIIGHTATHAALSGAGIYGSLRKTLLYRRHLADRVQAEIGDRPVRALGDPEVTVNLIPVDVVAGAAVDVVSSDSPATFFHLVNAAPPTLAEVTVALCDAAGIPYPEFVADTTTMSPLERRLADGALNRFFRPYFCERRDFDLANTTAVAGLERMSVPLDAARLRPYLDWYVRSLD